MEHAGVIVYDVHLYEILEYIHLHSRRNKSRTPYFTEKEGMYEHLA